MERKFSISISSIANGKFGIFATSWVEDDGKKTDVKEFRASAATSAEAAIELVNNWIKTV